MARAWFRWAAGTIALLALAAGLAAGGLASPDRTPPTFAGLKSATACIRADGRADGELPARLGPGQGQRHALNADRLRRLPGDHVRRGELLLNTTLGIYDHRDQTDLETAMDAYASWLEQQREDEIVPPEADR
jgi:hypothetical protein